jgi:hypothetical protein
MKAADALFEDASRRRFDCVLFWALDPDLDAAVRASLAQGGVVKTARALRVGVGTVQRIKAELR